MYEKKNFGNQTVLWYYRSDVFKRGTKQWANLPYHPKPSKHTLFQVPFLCIVFILYPFFTGFRYGRIFMLGLSHNYVVCATSFIMPLGKTISTKRSGNFVNIVVSVCVKCRRYARIIGDRHTAEWYACGNG